MKKLLIIFAIFFTAMTAWGTYSIKSYSPQEAINILATTGRKAWAAFNDTSTQIKRITKFGYNKDVDTGGTEILASFGGTFQQYGLSAETLNIASTDVDDTASSGTGANLLVVTCIDEDGLEVNIVVSMNGTTTVTTTQTCKFVNRAVVYTSGSSDSNEGDITISQTTSGVTMAQIPATKSTTQQVMYYIPSDRKCYIDNMFARARKLSGGGDVKVEFNVIVYSQTQDTLYNIRELFLNTASVPFGSLDDFKAEPLRPNEIITLELTTDTNNTVVTGSMDLTCQVQ